MNTHESLKDNILSVSGTDINDVHDIISEISDIGGLVEGDIYEINLGDNAKLTLSNFTESDNEGSEVEQLYFIDYEYTLFDGEEYIACDKISWVCDNSSDREYHPN